MPTNSHLNFKVQPASLPSLLPLEHWPALFSRPHILIATLLSLLLFSTLRKTPYLLFSRYLLPSAIRLTTTLYPLLACPFSSASELLRYLPYL
ncbi:hypothetical protein BR93DRAFT_923112, partial [Coniochaeta sp. PMI_546]